MSQKYLLYSISFWTVLGKIFYKTKSFPEVVPKLFSQEIQKDSPLIIHEGPDKGTIRNKMGQIHSFTAFYKSFFSLLSDYRHNKNSLKHTSNGFLREILENKHQYFPEKEIKRIRFYTSVAPVFVGYTHATLRDGGITEKEHSLMAGLSVLTPIFDDYFDAENADVDQLQKMILSPENHQPVDDKEKISISFYKILLKQSSSPDQLRQNIYQLFLAQLEGKKLNASTDKDILRKNAFEKGGRSAMLYRNMLTHPLKQGEEEAVRYFGGMIQWLDDLFDIYEDLQAGIYTLPNCSKDIHETGGEYENSLNQMIRLFESLDYKKENIRFFLDKLMIIFVRGMVCLEKLKETQDRYGNGFSPSQYERKDLICDMEKVSNLYKLYQCFSVYDKYKTASI